MASYKKLCWTGADVKCPFYKKDSRENRSICCEGFEKDSMMELKFKNLEQREKHLGCYCVSRYESCPAYQCTYGAKYRDEGD
jgi:hypothetical protein